MKKAIRTIPFDLADVMDRPPLKSVEDLDDDARGRVRAEFAARTAADLLRQVRQLDLSTTTVGELRDLLAQLAELRILSRPVTVAPAPKRRVARKRPNGANAKHLVPHGIAVEVVKGVEGWSVV